MDEPTLTVTEAARKFSDMINRARYRHESTLLVKNGVPVARVVPTGISRTDKKKLLGWWKSHPRLGKGDAGKFARTVARAKETLELPHDSWE